MYALSDSWQAVADNIYGDSFLGIFVKLTTVLFMFYIEGQYLLLLSTLLDALASIPFLVLFYRSLL